MNLNYYLLLRDKKIYIKTDIEEKILEYLPKIEDLKPNNPFYYNMFFNDDIIKDLNSFIKKS